LSCRPVISRYAARAGISPRLVSQDFGDLGLSFRAKSTREAERLNELAEPADSSLPLDQRIRPHRRPTDGAPRGHHRARRCVAPSLVARVVLARATLGKRRVPRRAQAWHRRARPGGPLPDRPSCALLSDLLRGQGFEVIDPKRRRTLRVVGVSGLRGPYITAIENCVTTHRTTRPTRRRPALWCGRSAPRQSFSEATPLRRGAWEPNVSMTRSPRSVDLMDDHEGICTADRTRCSCQKVRKIP